MYGVALQEKKANIIPSTPHVNYTLNEGTASENSVPKSIIFIIADGTGIGQYSLSYYANGDKLHTLSSEEIHSPRRWPPQKCL